MSSDHGQVKVAACSNCAYVERIFETAGYKKGEFQYEIEDSKLWSGTKRGFDISQDSSPIAKLVTGTYWLLILYDGCPSELIPNLKPHLIIQPRELKPDESVDTIAQEAYKRESIKWKPITVG